MSEQWEHVCPATYDLSDGRKGVSNVTVKLHSYVPACPGCGAKGGQISQTSATHELKCVPPFFQAVLDGTKPFEARKHDRPFAEGDTLHLREFCDGEYTGRECRRTVTYVLVGGEFGIERGYVVMGIRP